MPITSRIQPFYAADLPDDEVRVARLFKRAVREYKESVQQRSLSDGEFEQLVYKKCLMLVLVDRQHLPCYDCNFDDDDDSNDDDSNDQENANNYVGHFIVITGITRSGMFLYSDPNKSVSVCRCHAVDMHKARKAVGTDEDVIVIPTA